MNTADDVLNEIKSRNDTDLYNATKEDPALYAIAAEYMPKDRAVVQRVARVALNLEKVYDDSLVHSSMDSTERILTHISSELLPAVTTAVSELNEAIAILKKTPDKKDLYYKVGYAVASFIGGVGFYGVIQLFFH